MNLILVDENDLSTSALNRGFEWAAEWAVEPSGPAHVDHSESPRVDYARSPNFENERASHLTNGLFTLTDRRARHVCEIHRAKVGDALKVGFLNGKIGRGEVIAIDQDAKRGLFRVELKCEFTESPPLAPDIELWIALPRPKFLSKVVETATTFGIKRILFFNSFRVDKVYWSCDQITPGRLDESMRLGLEQAGDTILPVIQFEKLFKPFIEDRAQSLINGRKALLAHPVGRTPCPYQSKEPTTVAIGPEGGFIPYEIEKIQAAGFTCVELFPRILKVETAVAAILGRLI